jgi:hypothetical protein
MCAGHFAKFGAGIGYAKGQKIAVK